MSNKDLPYYLNIDGELLRQQQRVLFVRIDFLQRKRPSFKELIDCYEGMLALLEEIADQAHDNYGIDCLINNEDEDDPASPVPPTATPESDSTGESGSSG
jgi:hypothetical protein